MELHIIQFVGSILILASGPVFLIWLFQYLRYRRVSSWNESLGKVVDVEIETRISRGEDGENEYSPRIDYQYTVHGETHQNLGGRYSLVKNWGSRAWAETELKRLASSDPICVRYNPRRTEDSYLEVALPNALPCFLAFPCMMIGCWLITQG